ncbi:hypothetical protein MKEN_00835400 [Mycena kentingensis (nom. inval.)]|nr:hypothetical protein MKEN_00835400 [Mycena kentingensis (nom. inval.)]
MHTLETLLARAVATTSAIQLDGEVVPAYPPAIQALVRTLCSRVAVAPAPPTPTPTFASVAGSRAKPTTTTTSVNLPSANSHYPEAEHQNPASGPRRRNKRVNAAHRRNSAQRLIVRWVGDAPDQHLHSEEDIVTAISARSRADDVRVSAASWTASGNLALHVARPYTAEQLLPAEDRLHQALNDLWDLEDDAVLDLDAPWSKVVIHGVPREPFFANRAALWALLEPQGYSIDGMATAAPMLKGGADAPGRLVSIKLAFKDASAARRMVEERGIILYSTFCRVSRYRGPH